MPRGTDAFLAELGLVARDPEWAVPHDRLDHPDRSSR
jgi:hypothetical protein